MSIEKKSAVFAVRKEKKGKTEADTFWADVGTALIRPSGDNGVLFLNHLDGDFALFRKESDGKKATLYAVRKAKKGKAEADTFWADVGTLLVRDSGQNGVLFLNHLDGEFAVFLKDAERKKETGAVAEAA